MAAEPNPLRFFAMAGFAGAVRRRLAARLAVGFLFVCCMCTNQILSAATPNPPAAASPLIIPGPRPAGIDFPPWNDPVVGRLGYLLPQAIEEFGGPQEVGVVRGDEPRQDAVVFYYPDHSYLYWWGKRLWQIRFDGRYQGEIMSVEMGLSRAEVMNRLGTPFYVGADDLIYQLPDRGFPVRLRLIFSKTGLSDLYLYRADF